MSMIPEKIRVKRSPAQLAAFHQGKANAARGKAQKQAKKDADRRKILLGAGLTALVNAGGFAATKIAEGIKDRLTRSHDRALFNRSPLADSTGDTASLDALAATIRETAAINDAARQDWMQAVIAWERNAGRSWLKDGSPENRVRFGFGAIGELAPVRS